MSTETLGIETVKPAADGITLPTGYLTEDLQVITAMHIKEITGVEEDILASKKLSITRRLQKVMESCVESFGDLAKEKIGGAIKKLPEMDRMSLLISLRVLSLGPLYSFEVTCENDQCEKKSKQTVDLDEIKFSGIKDPLKRVFEEKLPKLGHTVRWEIMNGTNSEKIADMQQSKDFLSLMIFARVLDVNGKPVSLNQVKQWPLKDRDFLRSRFKEEEGKMDDIDVECPYCGHEFKADIDVGQTSFFFPAVASKH